MPRQNYRDFSFPGPRYGLTRLAFVTRANPKPKRLSPHFGSPGYWRELKPYCGIPINPKPLNPPASDAGGACQGNIKLNATDYPVRGNFHNQRLRQKTSRRFTKHVNYDEQKKAAIRDLGANKHRLVTCS